jgi:ribosome biogenesis protein MAK21
MFRLVHLLSNFNSSIQALALLYQITDISQSTASDRFYAALYRKLLQPEFGRSAKITVFLNLLYKAMKKDSSVNRFKAFVKRLLQVRCCL